MNANSPVYDAYESRNPEPWWRRRRSPGALELAAAALEECRRDQLHHAHLLEDHKAECVKLKEREARLLKDMQRLTKIAKQPDPGSVFDTDSLP